METVAVLASCGHDLPLTVIGEGPERDPHWSELTQRLGITALVRFVGDATPRKRGVPGAGRRHAVHRSGRWRGIAAQWRR